MAITEVATGLKFPEGPVVMDDGSVIVVEIAAGAIPGCCRMAASRPSPNRGRPQRRDHWPPTARSMSATMAASSITRCAG